MQEIFMLFQNILFKEITFCTIISISYKPNDIFIQLIE